jgi:GNAT superfamily N-acetyltransferase
MIEQIKKMIEEFGIRLWCSRQWLADDNIKIYVRVTKHYLPDGEVVKTIDLSSIEVEEAHRGRGLFTRKLEEIELLASERGFTIYVESILNERLIPFFEKRGYRRVDNLQSMFLRPDK